MMEGFKEKLRGNQWWLLLTLGMAAFGGGWFLTKNLLVSVGSAVLAYFVVSLKQAAAWPSFFLLLCSSGLGLLITRNIIGGKTGLMVGAIGGFLGGFALLVLLHSIRRRAGEEKPTRTAESGAEGEPLRVQTTVGGPRGLDIGTVATLLGGQAVSDLIQGLGFTEGERERIKASILNPLGYATDQQIADTEAATQRARARPRRRRFPIRPGKKGIPRS